MPITQNTKAFFTNPEYIFQMYAGYLDSNIDANSLNTFILISQFEETEQLLGYNLYYQYVNFLTPVVPGDSSTAPINSATNSQYKYLLDNWIIDSVSLWTIYYSLDALHLRVTNKSIVTKNSQFSVAVDDKRLTRLKYNVQERAKFVDARVIEYIMNNTGSFPEYFSTTGVMRLTPKRDPYAGIFSTARNSSRRGYGSYGCDGCGRWLPGFGNNA